MRAAKAKFVNAICLLTNIPGFATVKNAIADAFDVVGNVINRLITGLQGKTVTNFFAFVKFAKMASYKVLDA